MKKNEDSRSSHARKNQAGLPRKINYRKMVIVNTLLSSLAYAVVISYSAIARAFGLITFKTEYLLVVVAYWIVSSGIFLLVTALLKRISGTLSITIGVLQLINWSVIYFMLAVVNNEHRYVVLLFAFIALIYLLSFGSRRQAGFLIVFIMGLYLAATYVGMEYFGQSGSWKLASFHLLCFLPSAVFMGVMAGVFKKERETMKRIRREAEVARDALWGEMAIAKKIQTVLLPSRPAISGYEISAYMAPAAEVGGDYYDVINVGGKDWIVIGDVSGHGVPAGLIMMMVQTAIHTVLSGNDSRSPDDLLVQINRVITGNIKKLNEDKYMTITVIACVSDGHFYYSGLHLDIMIYRHETETVENLETNGIWLGILDEIHGMVKEERFHLGRGDVMLLYTDGITEAWRRGALNGVRNPEADMYGHERLEKTFRSLGALSTSEIKSGLIESLSGYQVNDDITMVVMKRLGD